jgi:hypothetical protein
LVRPQSPDWMVHYRLSREHFLLERAEGQEGLAVVAVCPVVDFNPLVFVLRPGNGDWTIWYYDSTWLGVDRA